MRVASARFAAVTAVLVASVLSTESNLQDIPPSASVQGRTVKVTSVISADPTVLARMDISPTALTTILLPADHGDTDRTDDEKSQRKDRKEWHDSKIEGGQNDTPKAATPAPAPKATPAPKAEKKSGGSSTAAKALATAMSKMGKPYVWGAAGPNAFDCSGLVQWAYKQWGISLPHSSAAQSKIGTSVAKDDLRPGDLVFFYSPVSHVGIYVGNGKVLNASESGQPVKLSTLANMPFHNARRL